MSPDDSTNVVRDELTDRPAISAQAVRKVLEQGGCALCGLLEPLVDGVLMEWLGARHLSPMMRASVRGAHGFCAPHAWWLLAEGAAQSVMAAGLDYAVRMLLVDVQRAVEAYWPDKAEGDLHSGRGRSERASEAESVMARLSATARCPLCVDVRRLEETVGGQFLALLRVDELRTMYTPASALCMPHFRWALRAALDTTVLDCLVAAERERVETLLAVGPGAGWRVGLAHLAGGARVMSARGERWEH